MENKSRFKIGDEAIIFKTENDYGAIQKIIIGEIIISEMGVSYKEKGECLSHTCSEDYVFTKEEVQQKIQEFLNAK